MPLFVLLLGMVFVVTPMWAVVQSVFAKRLRERHREIMNELGAPTNAFDYSLLDMLRWLGFVFRRKYRLLGDKTLMRLGDLLLVLIVIVLCSWVGVMIAPLDLFVRMPF